MFLPGLMPCFGLDESLVLQTATVFRLHVTQSGFEPESRLPVGSHKTCGKTGQLLIINCLENPNFLFSTNGEL